MTSNIFVDSYEDLEELILVTEVEILQLLILSFDFE